MRKKIFTGIAVVAIAIMLVSTGLVTEIIYDYMGDKIDEQLADEASLVERGWLLDGEEYLETLEKNANIGSRITLLSSSGEVRYVPAALALHQRPGIPGIRSTFGTGTELLNSLRLMYSRLASHRCPNGHYVEPTLNVAAEQEIICPVCGEKVHAPSAEELAFNSQGACTECARIFRSVN